MWSVQNQPASGGSVGYNDGGWYFDASYVAPPTSGQVTNQMGVLTAQSSQQNTTLMIVGLIALAVLFVFKS